MRVHLDNGSALTCIKVHTDDPSALSIFQRTHGTWNTSTYSLESRPSQCKRVHLDAFQCTGIMTVHLDHGSALGCVRVHSDHGSAQGCIIVHLDNRL